MIKKTTILTYEWHKHPKLTLISGDITWNIISSFIWVVLLKWPFTTGGRQQRQAVWDKVKGNHDQ